MLMAEAGAEDAVAGRRGGVATGRDLPATGPAPHGGVLIQRLASSWASGGVASGPALALDAAAETHLENVAIGVLSPLTGFMDRDTALAVARTGRLPGGLPWTLPILLPAREADTAALHPGGTVTLIGTDGQVAGYLWVREVFTLDPGDWVGDVFGTTDPAHPGVARALSQGRTFVAGDVMAVRLRDLPGRVTPQQTRAAFAARGWKTVAAFQTRNIPHRGHEFVQRWALSITDGLFLSPVIGRKKAGDFRDEVILGAYRTLREAYFPENRVTLGTIAYEMAYAGPREAIHHAIIRKNYGATHFLVGRDHAGVGSYYGPYDAQALFAAYPDLGITMLPMREVQLCEKCGGYVAQDSCPHKAGDVVHLSATAIRKMLENEAGHPALAQMLRPEVAETIRAFVDPLVME